MKIKATINIQDYQLEMEVPDDMNKWEVHDLIRHAFFECLVENPYRLSIIGVDYDEVNDKK